MPAGVILLLLIAVLIYFGLLQRVLDRMHMTDIMAIIFIGAMVVGSFTEHSSWNPSIHKYRRWHHSDNFSRLSYCHFRYQCGKSQVYNSLYNNGAAVYIAGKLLPAEPGTMIIDPIIAFAVLAGVIAYVFGRSRRGAFIAGTLGIIISDIVSALGVTARPIGTTIGGAGLLTLQLSQELLQSAYVR